MNEEYKRDLVRLIIELHNCKNKIEFTDLSTETHQFLKKMNISFRKN
jgi:hypothetical protein